MSCTAVDTSTTQQLSNLWLAEAKLYGQKDPYLGKRQYPRFKWQVPVELDVEAIDGSRSRLCACTRDISEGGIGLECRQPLEADSLVHVRMAGQSDTVAGYVVHCTQSVGRYLIGIVFTMNLAA